MNNNLENMCFVYPSSPLNLKNIDENYIAESICMKQNGFAIALISIENMDSGLIFLTPKQLNSYIVIYRGWMLTPDEYTKMEKILVGHNLTPLTSVEQYLQAHYLPNWYPLLTDLTPETKIFQPDENLPYLINQLGWNKYFIKDYVKSLKTSIGSIITSSSDINILIKEMKKFRGIIEGGICVRRIEDFIPETEKRYFVIKNVPYSFNSNEQIPQIIYECSHKINSQFFSIDLIQRSDRLLRIVEIGDGQVSDLVGWNVERFAEIWLLSIKRSKAN